MLSWIWEIYQALRQVHAPHFLLWKMMSGCIWHICPRCRSTPLCSGCGCFRGMYLRPARSLDHRRYDRDSMCLLLKSQGPNLLHVGRIRLLRIISLSSNAK